MVEPLAGVFCSSTGRGTLRPPPPPARGMGACVAGSERLTSAPRGCVAGVFPVSLASKSLQRMGMVCGGRRYEQ